MKEYYTWKKFCFGLILAISLPSLDGISAEREIPASSHLPVYPFQSTLKIGDQISNFSLRSTSGQTVSLTDFGANKGVIVVFISNHCPFAKAYEDRLIALSSKFSPQGIKIVAINSSDQGLHPDDSFEKMKDRANAKGYNFSYLSDDKQVVAKAFGATREPQAFLLRKNGAAFVLSYMGMIDDNPQDQQGVLKYYIDEAATNLLENKPVVTTITKAVGCPIKWKN